VNDERHATNPKMDFSAMTDKDLEEMARAVQREVESRKEQKKQDAILKMQAIAEEVGMTPEELLGLSGGRRRRGGKRGVVAWQHPDDPSLIYRGGKKPDWLKKLREEGREAVRVE